MNDFFVKKYVIKPGNIVRWLVVGKNREYLLNEYSCTCKSFQMQLSKKTFFYTCKHQTTLKNATTTGMFDSFEISIPEYQQLREFFLNIKK